MKLLSASGVQEHALDKGAGSEVDLKPRAAAEPDCSPCQFFDLVPRGTPLPVSTAIASVAAGAFRIFLMPLDTCKVVLQVSQSLDPAIFSKPLELPPPGAT